MQDKDKAKIIYACLSRADVPSINAVITAFIASKLSPHFTIFPLRLSLYSPTSLQSISAAMMTYGTKLFI